MMATPRILIGKLMPLDLCGEVSYLRLDLDHPATGRDPQSQRNRQPSKRHVLQVWGGSRKYTKGSHGNKIEM